MQDFHPALIANLQRLLNNLIRSGTIASVKGNLAKVQTGEIITAPLPWFTARAGNAKTWWQPSIGEQVFILSPGGNLELGCILPAIYSANNAPPAKKDNCHTVFSDGATFNYDPSSSTLKIDGVKNIIINSSEKVSVTTNKASVTAIDVKLQTQTAEVTAAQTTLSSPLVNVTSSDINLTAAKINLNAPLVQCAGVLAFASLAGAGGGAPSVISGDIVVNGQLVNNGVNLSSHTHNVPSIGQTSPPI